MIKNLNIDWIKENFKPFFISCVILGGWTAFNFKLSLDHLGRSEEFQRYKVNEIETLSNRELKLKENEFKLRASISAVERNQMEAEAIKKQTESRLEEIRQKELQLADAENAVSIKKQRINDESDIHRLMNEVSALGVDLQAQPPCENPDLLSKYFRGVSLIREIAQRARSANLYENYQGYLNSNSRWIVFSENCTKKPLLNHVKSSEVNG